MKGKRERKGNDSVRAKWWMVVSVFLPCVEQIQLYLSLTFILWKMFVCFTVHFEDHLNTLMSSAVLYRLRGSLFNLSSTPGLPSLLTLWHICDVCASPAGLVHPTLVSHSVAETEVEGCMVSDRLTAVHHSLAQKNQQHDGCAPPWHLQPEPQAWFKSTPLSLFCSVCVWWLTNSTLGPCMCLQPITQYDETKSTNILSVHTQLFCLNITLFHYKNVVSQDIQGTNYFWVQKTVTQLLFDSRWDQDTHQSSTETEFLRLMLILIC